MLRREVLVPRWDEYIGIMVVTGLDRRDTVAREPSMRAKTIIIPTVRVRIGGRVECNYIDRAVYTIFCRMVRVFDHKSKYIYIGKTA